MRIGLVANEFFDEGLGRMGGFGMLAKELALLLRTPEFGSHEVVILSGERHEGLSLGVGATSYSTPIVSRISSRGRWLSLLMSIDLDLLISIDYRPLYRLPFLANLRTPLIVWIQDPRPLEDVSKVNSLVLPDGSDAAGIEPIDCTNFRLAYLLSQLTKRKIRFASPAQFLLAKACSTYSTSIPFASPLGYPVRFPDVKVTRSPNPTFLYLGRLDPIKRPWLLLEAARQVPDVQFVVLGKAHFGTSGYWNEVPANVELLGHVEGEKKWELLASSWALINTSIHEALPVSFVEALGVGTRIIASQDPDGIVTRFGHFLGREDGIGWGLLDDLVSSLQAVAMSPTNTKSSEAIDWAHANHGVNTVAAQFNQLLKSLES